MISGVILWAVISLVIIMLTHNIYIFFKDTLTVPKVKDFINEPNNIYKEVEETLKKERENINNNTNNNKINNTNNNTINTTNNNTNNKTNNMNENEMKDELKHFFKKLNKEKQMNLGNYNTNYSSSIF